MRKVFQSFSARLMFYMLNINVIIFVCIAVVFSKYSKDTEEEQAVKYTTLLQRNMVQLVDFEMENVEQLVRDEAQHVIRHMGNPEAMMEIVQRMSVADSIMVGASVAFVSDYYSHMGKGKEFMEYAFVDPAGTVHVKHLGGTNYDYLHKEWFVNAYNSRMGVWSAPYYDKGCGNQLMTTYSLALRNDSDQVFCVLSADVSLEDLSRKLFDIRPYEDSYSFIVNNKGTYVAHPNKEYILNKSIFDEGQDDRNKDLIDIGHRMVAEESGWRRCHIDDTDVIACYAPLHRISWTVCSVIPYSSVLDDLGSTILFVFCVLLIGLVVLSVSVRFLVRYITKPIHELTNAAYQIARGNFQATLPVVETKDDLRQLHDAFEFMQKSLTDYMNELQTSTRNNERMESELTIAHNIQMNMVPKTFSPFPENENLDLYAVLKPAKEVGGDFYDFHIRENKLFFCVGDVSGKGVPASLVMAISRALFRMLASKMDNPAKIVNNLNNVLSDGNESNMFVTMFVGILDLNNGALDYCNAGHNPPLIISTQGKARYEDVLPNLPLGIMTGFEYKGQTDMLDKQQTLLLYTDGLTEAENMQHELYGEEEPQRVAMQQGHLPVKEIIEHMITNLESFVGEAPQSDDLTMLCLRLNNNNDKMAMNEKRLVVKNEKELVLNNSLDDSVKLVPFIEELGLELKMDPQLVSSLNLALEEAMVNSILYAYPKGEKGNIVLRALWEDNPKSVRFELLDQGKPFDPTKAKEADVTLAVEDRPIGGLGIFLIRKIMDSVTYERVGDTNKLIMIKQLCNDTQNTSNK